MSHLPAVSPDSLKRFEEARAVVVRGRTFTTDSATPLRDAQYVALAELYQAQLWTADERMFNALAGHAPFAHLLWEYQPAEAPSE